MSDYKKFATPRDVDEWVRENYTEEQLRSLDVKTNPTSPLYDYKNSGYKKINELVRKGYANNKDLFDIPAIQEFLTKCVIPEDVRVYRFVSLKELIILEIKTIFGKDYQYPTFLSTTLLKGYYAMSEIRKNKIAIEILADKSARGTYIPEVNPQYPEFEVLFAHSCSLVRDGFRRYRLLAD